MLKKPPTKRKDSPVKTRLSPGPWWMNKLTNPTNWSGIKNCNVFESIICQTWIMEIYTAHYKWFVIINTSPLTKSNQLIMPQWADCWFVHLRFHTYCLPAPVVNMLTQTFIFFGVFCCRIYSLDSTVVCSANNLIHWLFGWDSNRTPLKIPRFRPWPFKTKGDPKLFTSVQLLSNWSHVIIWCLGSVRRR